MIAIVSSSTNPFLDRAGYNYRLEQFKLDGDKERKVRDHQFIISPGGFSAEWRTARELGR
jgi:hypothetical protein